MRSFLSLSCLCGEIVKVERIFRVVVSEVQWLGRLPLDKLSRVHLLPMVILVVVKWLAELVSDHEVLGSNPATSILFAREPAITKFVQYQCTQKKE